jgi:hypothetical protein
MWQSQSQRRTLLDLAVDYNSYFLVADKVALAGQHHGWGAQPGVWLRQSQDVDAAGWAQLLMLARDYLARAARLTAGGRVVSRMTGRVLSGCGEVGWGQLGCSQLGWDRRCNKAYFYLCLRTESLPQLTGFMAAGQHHQAAPRMRY